MKYVLFGVLLGVSLLLGGAVLSRNTVLLDDHALCRLTIRENFDHRLMWATDYVLEVQGFRPLKISYLLLDASATPKRPTQGMDIRGSNFVAGWELGRQYLFRVEEHRGLQYFPFPHYRTVLLVFAGNAKVYAVFLRENDGRITSLVLQGGPFEHLVIPELGEVRFQDGSLEVRSFGEPIEVGLWMSGRYLHDEVAGHALPEFAQNPKSYALPKGFFMAAFARYGRMGVLIGEVGERGCVAIALSESRTLEREEVLGLCTLKSTSGPEVLVESLSGPVEVAHFSFDNTCYQWEVGGRALPEFRENPQVLPLKHYTPGFFLVSRYEKAGLFFYNENDGIVGVVPVGVLS